MPLQRVKQRNGTVRAASGTAAIVESTVSAATAVVAVELENTVRSTAKAKVAKATEEEK
jgi:hypothetical protein